MSKEIKSANAESDAPALKKKERGLGSMGIAFISFLSASVLITVIFAAFGYAPFGSRALLYSDADYQYFDLVLYYKRVLAGDDSFFYTFGKSLGGNNYAVFAYYLASPVMLLSLLFRPEDTALCLNVISAVKMALAAGTCGFALTERFKDREEKRAPYAVLIAVSYGLSQYMISQTCNCMWLDGAVMLPLAILGTYKMLKGRSGLLLAFSIALGLIFNWYTGIINCMFSAVWFFFELALLKARFIKSVLRYALYMLTGILMSGIILVPVLLIQADRTHGSGMLGELMKPGFIGNPGALISDYAPGVICIEGYCSLYAGSLVLLGTILFFFCKAFEKRVKITVFVMLLFTAMTYVFRPLVTVFSIFRNVESYWYRYSYTGIFLLCFIAAACFLKGEEIKARFVIMSGTVSALLSVLFSLLIKADLQRYLYLNNIRNTFGISISSDIMFAASKVVILLIITLVLFLVYLDKHGLGAAFNVIMVSIVTVLELVFAGGLLLNFYSNDKALEASSYVRNERELIGKVMAGDEGGFYRISQTSERSAASTGNTANYNEGMGYGFNSVSSFVSAPEEEQGTFLAKLGYPFHSETITVTASPLIPADSLLGVRYVMSEYDCPGMVKITDNKDFKNAYKNPYCLPAAFKVESAPVVSSPKSPFEYMNEVYSEILGEEVMIFGPAEFTAVKEEKLTEFRVLLPGDNRLVYGRLLPGENVTADTEINGVYKLTTGKFLSPDAFVVPFSSGEQYASVKAFTGKDISAEFYILDLDAFEEAVSRIRAKQAKSIDIREGYVKITADASGDGEKLFISIPYDPSWTVTVNGKTVVPDTFDGCMTLVTLEKGTNEIVMEYRAPYMIQGALASASGLVLALAAGLVCAKRNKNQMKAI